MKTKHKFLILLAALTITLLLFVVATQISKILTKTIAPSTQSLLGGLVTTSKDSLYSALLMDTTKRMEALGIRKDVEELWKDFEEERLQFGNFELGDTMVLHDFIKKKSSGSLLDKLKGFDEKYEDCSLIVDSLMIANITSKTQLFKVSNNGALLIIFSKIGKAIRKCEEEAFIKLLDK